MNKLQILNQLYNESCKPKCNRYKKISNNVILIDNFFENFDKARSFFINREKWKCTQYQDYSKPGYETVFPGWVGKTLIEKYLKDHEISIIKNPEIVVNYFYNELDQLWSLSSSNYFPHIDGIENNGILEYICLVNLNKVSISTKFYSYKNKETCDNEMIGDWINYYDTIQDELLNFYSNQKITRNEVKNFLDGKENEIKIKLVDTIEYDQNQAIIYPSNTFHCPNVTGEFFENNPRSVLRISFHKKLTKNA